MNSQCCHVNHRLEYIFQISIPKSRMIINRIMSLAYFFKVSHLKWFLAIKMSPSFADSLWTPCLPCSPTSKQKSLTLYLPWNSKHDLGKLNYKPEWTAILFNHPSIWTANIWWAMTLWCITRHFSGLRLGPDVPLCDSKNI